MKVVVICPEHRLPMLDELELNGKGVFLCSLCADMMLLNTRDRIPAGAPRVLPAESRAFDR